VTDHLIDKLYECLPEYRPEEDLLDNFLCRLELNIYKHVAIQEMAYKTNCLFESDFQQAVLQRDRAATIQVLGEKGARFSNIEMRMIVKRKGMELRIGMIQDRVRNMNMYRYIHIFTDI